MILYIQFLFTCLQIYPTSVNFNSRFLKFSMYNPTSTLSNFYNTLCRLVTTQTSPSRDSCVFSSDCVTNHLKAYRSLDGVTFEDYSELQVTLAGWRASRTDTVFLITAWSLLSNRVKQFQFSLTPIKTPNTYFFLFNLRGVFFLKTLLIKLPTTTTPILHKINSLFTVRFSPTNIAKYLTSSASQFLEILFLRKSKIFNKGRYSRNRQFYRTGVYWCLYINIIAMVGLYFWFYRFVMNFGYLWWMLYISVVIFALAKSFQYGLLLPHKLVKSLKEDALFFATLFSTLCTKILMSATGVLTKSADIKTALNRSINYVADVFVGLVTTRYILGVLGVVSVSLTIRKFTSINYYIYSITLDHSRVFLDAKKHDSVVSFLKTLLH